MDEERQKELKLKRGNNVEKYRQYRNGDFPDIQIKFSELIAPIQALAQRDDQIAMTLFNNLMSSILSEITYLKSENETKVAINSIEQNLNSMLSISESYDPNFIECILEISLKHANLFKVDISYITNACLNSFHQSVGIVLIEEYLILLESESDDSQQPSTKRFKPSNEIEKTSDKVSLINR